MLDISYVFSMDRTWLLQQLQNFRSVYAEEQSQIQRVIKFLEEEPDAFHRTLLKGHVTGSAWIVTPDFLKVLLTHHRKLGRWQQLGGHADGDEDIVRVAEREAYEESGLPEGSIMRAPDPVFDVDIHIVPAYGTEPEHVHYDIRVLLFADADAPLKKTHESNDLAWFPMDAVEHIPNLQDAVLRLVEKSKERTITQ